MKPLTPKDLKEMESRAHMCEEATIPGDRLRALIHTAQLAYEMKEALKDILEQLEPFCKLRETAPRLSQLGFVYKGVDRSSAVAKIALILWEDEE